MLVLTRREQEKIVITLEDGRTIEVWPTITQSNQVRLAVDAPRTIRVDREEVLRSKEAS